MNKKQLYKNLTSKNDIVVLEALKDVKSQGDKDAIPIMAELLVADKSESITSVVFEIFNGLKDSRCIPEIIKLITNPRFVHVRKELLSSCWQNGLNYTPYLNVFVDAVVQEPYESAFEAFTVIDEMMVNVQPGTIEVQINTLLDSKHKVSDDKQAMINQLIQIFMENR